MYMHLWPKHISFSQQSSAGFLGPCHELTATFGSPQLAPEQEELHAGAFGWEFFFYTAHAALSFRSFVQKVSELSLPLP